MNNYEFVFVSTDNYELRYTDKNGNNKVLPFKRTIALASKLQGITATARLKMFKELTSMGITKDDLIIKIDNLDGTTTYNETNYREYEKKYIETQSALILNEIIEECFKMSIVELLEDMGVDPNSEDVTITQKVANFSKKFTTIIVGGDSKEPSSGDIEPLSTDTEQK